VIKTRGTGRWGTEASLFDADAEVAQDVAKVEEGVSDKAEATPQFRRPQGAKTMSTKQAQTLRDMIAERDGQDGIQALRDRLNKARDGGYLTTTIFTEVFTALRAIPRATKVAEAPVERPAKRNLYAKDCNACGRNVEASAGFVMRGDEGNWVVWHEVCPTAFPFPEGRYALEREDGSVRFYHLVDGQVFVMASDEEHEIHGAAATAIIEAIAVDALEAAKRYGREIESCGICGRTLTSDWRKVGIGPVCSKRGFGV
jgi:hypothetical protein